MGRVFKEKLLTHDEVNNCQIHCTKFDFGGKKYIGAMVSYCDGGKFVADIPKGPTSMPLEVWVVHVPT